MRRVTCKDCRKQYDYDRDDFCPKCGAFNPPQEGARSATGRAATVRPAAAPSRGTPLASPSRSTPRPGASMPHSVQPQYSGATPEVTPGAAHSARLEGCSACEETPRRNQRKPRVLLAAIVVLVAVVVVALPAVTESIQSSPYFAGIFSGGVPAEPEDVTHDLGESFPLNDATVSVDGYSVVDVSTDPKAVREGYDCVGVSLWLEEGTRQPNLRIDIPTLVLADGTALYPEDDALLKRRLREFGLFPIALADYQWEDPLYGHLIYYVPTGETEGMTLQILEFAPGNVDTTTLLARHSVALEQDD